MTETYAPEPDEAPPSWTSNPETLSRLAIESLPHGVLVLTSDGTILVVNRAIERQFGYRREALIGRNADMLLSQESRPQHTADRTTCVTDPSAMGVGALNNCSGRRQDGSEF